MPAIPRLLKNPRLLAGAAGVALLAVVALRPRPVPVDVAPLSRGPLVVTLDEEGETRVIRRFLVTAPVSGRLLRIDLRPGDPVVQGGTTLATILPGDPTPLDARSRAEAEAALAAARATLDGARAEAGRAAAAESLAAAQLARTKSLAADGIASGETLDARSADARSAAEGKRAAEFAVATATHQVEAARARLAQARGAAERPGTPLEVHAPITGTVLRRLRESEGPVVAGEPLVELGDPSDLEIVADYLSTDAVRIRPGSTVRIERWGGGGPLAGVVRRVEPAGFTKVSALGVEEQRVNVLVDFAGPAAERAALGDGYRVEVAAVLAERAMATKLPVSALFRHEGEWAVFAVEHGRARRRPVQIGERNPLEAELLGGLPDGAEVVLHPPDSLDDGSRIERR